MKMPVVNLINISNKLLGTWEQATFINFQLVKSPKISNVSSLVGNHFTFQQLIMRSTNKSSRWLLLAKIHLKIMIFSDWFVRYSKGLQTWRIWKISSQMKLSNICGLAMKFSQEKRKEIASLFKEENWERLLLKSGERSLKKWPISYMPILIK